MYIKAIHILIEQGLQEIGVFAYADMLPEEIDLVINASMFKMMDEQIEPLKNIKDSREKKFKLQYILDRFQNLQVKELPFTPTKVDNYYKLTLPDDYLHLIADISEVLYECNGTNIVTGKIITNHLYLVKGQKSIIYNNVTYPTGSVITGVVNVIGYTYSGTGTLELLELKVAKKANRLTEEEYLYEVLDNSLEKTDIDSPVSSLSGNILYTYVEDFFINRNFLTYLRKPKRVNSKFTTYTAGTNLVVNSRYESVTVGVVYNGISYAAFQPFTVVTGVLVHIGAPVRIYQDGDTEFTESISYELINRVVIDLSIKTEQPQQKITNLAQENV